MRTGFENQFFLKRTQKKIIWESSKVWPLTQVKVSRFSHRQKFVQASNEKEVMSIKYNYASIQNGTTFYLLDLVDHSWTIGLNFGSTVLSQLNLIRAKEMTFSSSNPHQNLHVRSLGNRRFKGALVFSGRCLLTVGQVRW